MNKMNKVLKKFLELIRKNKFASILIAIPVVPVMINYLLLTWHFPGAQNADWLGFLSNYSGGIIGGIVAFVVANHQVKIQMEEQIKNEEEVKYINQLPTLINITFELGKMKSSIEKVHKMRDEYEKINVGMEELINLDNVQYIMESINLDNWSSVKDIQDVDFQKSLFDLKNTYEDITKALNFNLDDTKNEIESIIDNRGIINNSLLEFEQRSLLNKLIIDQQVFTDKKRDAWEKLKNKDYPALIDESLKITDVMMKSIEELMENRHQIRDKN